MNSALFGSRKYLYPLLLHQSTRSSQKVYLYYQKKNNFSKIIELSIAFTQWNSASICFFYLVWKFWCLEEINIWLGATIDTVPSCINFFRYNFFVIYPTRHTWICQNCMTFPFVLSKQTVTGSSQRAVTKTRSDLKRPKMTLSDF